MASDSSYIPDIYIIAGFVIQLPGNCNVGE